LRAQFESANVQLALIAEELQGKEQLRRREIISKPELLKLQRAEAEIQGRRGEYLGNISRVKQQIGETRNQLLALDAERADQIATQLDQARVDLATTTERLHASKDVLNRTIVPAPVSGTVVNLRIKTEGGVIQRGEPILDIVPAEEVLLLDARVSPADIDAVQIGLQAQVNLTAYASRGLPRINGVVRSLSADRLVDPVSNQPYYLARVEVDRAELRRIDPRLELVPGMPAEVLIVTRERTVVQYLWEPLQRAFWRSMREV
jgi:HlyD family secretion protein/epimerase transport system membrane fusion protein